MRQAKVKQGKIALFILGVLILWMLSRFVVPPSLDEKKISASNNRFSVLVKSIKSEDHYITFKAHGSLNPNKIINIRSEAAGQVIKVLKKDGDFVKKDTLLAKIDLQDKLALLAREEAKKEETEANLIAIQHLKDKGYAAKVKVMSAKAKYKEAIARIELIKKSIKNTKITAPSEGLLAKQWVEEGDYVKVGEKLFELVNNNPLVVKVQVSQQQIGRLSLNQKVKVILVTGEKLEGVIAFLSPVANTSTRTFLVEVNVANTKNIPAGFSATVIFQSEKVKAHLIKPAQLSLSIDGQIGVKGIEKKDEVVFYPVNIISGDSFGVWVLGLPQSVTLITRGQGYAKIGSKVNTQYESTH